MNNAMTISITCKDDETKARYTALAAKMEADEQFKASLNNCKSEESIYDLYKNHGYTDLSFETFRKEFADMIKGIINVRPEGSFELSEDELENVVGGAGDLFRIFTAAINYIPIAGPLLAGVARGIKAGIEGKGADEVVKQVMGGVGLMLVDAVVSIASGGLGAGAVAAIKFGTGCVKAGINEAMIA